MRLPAYVAATPQKSKRIVLSEHNITTKYHAINISVLVFIVITQ